MHQIFLDTIPNFNNPSGITLAAERRQEIVDICREAGILILEDNPYGMLRYEQGYRRPGAAGSRELSFTWVPSPRSSLWACASAGLRPDPPVPPVLPCR